MRNFILLGALTCIAIATFPNVSDAAVIGVGRETARQVCSPARIRAFRMLSAFMLPQRRGVGNYGLDEAGMKAIKEWGTMPLPKTQRGVRWDRAKGEPQFIRNRDPVLDALYDVLEAMRASRLYAPEGEVRRAFHWDRLTPAEQEDYQKVGGTTSSDLFLSFTSSVLIGHPNLDELIGQSSLYGTPLPGIFGEYEKLLKADSVLVLKTCGESSRVRNVALFSDHPHEDEALMMPMTKFTITGFKQEKFSPDQVDKIFKHTKSHLKLLPDGSYILRKITATEVCSVLPAGMRSSPGVVGSDRAELERLIEELKSTVDADRRAALKAIKKSLTTGCWYPT